MAGGPNHLYYGDNLRILRDRIPGGSVDLIYLDPPFNSNRSYNVLFRTQTGIASAAQIQAFDDTWTWTQQTEALFATMIGGGAPPRVADALAAMRNLLTTSDVNAYLVMMTARLVELHRVLKPTGSLYLHCDPTASHYLKVMLDAVFGPEHFRNEIIWKRANAHNDPKRFGRVSDSILYYGKSQQVVWNTQHTEYREDYYKSHYTEDDAGRYYRTVPLDAPRHGQGSPGLLYEWRGKLPAVTRTWAVRREKMEEYEEAGLLRYTRTGTPTLLQYADEMPGVPLQNIWTDIPPVNPQARERLGYPTQKPLALLERIIASSSNEGDMVLDPFCGCGTAVDAAEKLHRRWIGIDVTYLAVDLIRKRLRHTYGAQIEDAYTVHGVPADMDGARALFAENPFDFERWAVSLIDAQPNEKQVGDRGIDGRVRFFADENRIGQVLVSVKGGGSVNPAMLRDLGGTVKREKVEMGILITLAEPTRGIREEADKSGNYTATLTGQTYPLLQVVTVGDLMAGRGPKMPTAILPYLKASPTRRTAPGEPDQLTLNG